MAKGAIRHPFSFASGHVMGETLGLPWSLRHRSVGIEVVRNLLEEVGKGDTAES